ncbi:MAG: hypothetical protein M0R02_04255 [Bacteroidales bacterium]|nr:hypothetical protein [Bacteroidales bacterium]
MTPTEILEKLYQQAAKNLSNSKVKVGTKGKIELVCRCTSNFGHRSQQKRKTRKRIARNHSYSFSH